MFGREIRPLACTVTNSFSVAYYLAFFDRIWCPIFLPRILHAGKITKSKKKKKSFWRRNKIGWSFLGRDWSSSKLTYAHTHAGICEHLAIGSARNTIVLLCKVSLWNHHYLTLGWLPASGMLNHLALYFEIFWTPRKSRKQETRFVNLIKKRSRKQRPVAD